MRFLFVDRIMQLSPGEMVKGIKYIAHDEHYLCRDPLGRLCFIPSLIGETLGQLAAWNVMVCNNFTHRPVAGIVGSAHVHRPVYVGETILLESFIDSLDDAAVRYHSIARVGDEIVFHIEDALGPLLPMAEFIEPTEVRQQFAEINHPGEWSLSNISQMIANRPPKISSGHIAPLEFDHLINCQPGQSITAEKKISCEAPYFPDHFPNKPVLPMTILLECKLNLARLFLEKSQWVDKYQIRELRKIKMNEFVYPGDVLLCHLKVKQQQEDELILSYRSEVDGRRVCVLDVVMTAKGVL
ncbi:hydroxymyristoyl-ACP dehydratase [Legionella oakridgensis]|uniref:hydroxymyristoyl-ACP dehydratase n=1 Tax=Legionella oakridgensis TaxID=29423 RepID=UPI0003DE0FC2|nr:hydroxymyristoyl-ACP dehydratase [Legionella oakridgensis]ETO94235.1 3-hydroxymyristoyl/3-hydroxydecanoyl-(acyl carrier protein) dehydratase [Legionella oakridgensis RV-2-2007]